MKLNRAAFEQLIADDVSWLVQQAPSLERQHIAQILLDAANVYYPPTNTDGMVAVDRLLLWLANDELAARRSEKLGTADVLCTVGYVDALHNLKRNLHLLVAEKKHP